MERKAEGIPKPLWRAAKEIHKQEALVRSGYPGDGTFPRFKDLSEWAQAHYLRSAKKVIKAYRKGEE